MINVFSWLRNLLGMNNSSTKKTPKTFKFKQGKISYDIFVGAKGMYYINRPARNGNFYKWYIPTELINEFYEGKSKHIQ